MAENACAEDYCDGVIINEKARFRNLIKGLFNELDEIEKKRHQEERNQNQGMADSERMGERNLFMEQSSPDENREEKETNKK